jgi:hypothetical protein
MNLVCLDGGTIVSDNFITHITESVKLFFRVVNY